MSEVNDKTWAIVHDEWAHELPDRKSFDSGDHKHTRVLCFSYDMSCGTLYEGEFFTVDKITHDWGDCRYPPEFAVDLTQPPEQAYVPLAITVSRGGPNTNLSEYFG